MRLAKAFGTSKTAEQQGNWLDIFDPQDGTWMFSVKLARYGGQNNNLAAVRERVMGPYRHLPTGMIDKDLGAKLARVVFAEACCLDWATPAGKADLFYDEDIPKSAYAPPGVQNVESVQGVEQADGRVVPFSVEALDKLFEAVPQIFTTLIGQAADFNFYKSELREADAKN